MSNSNNKYKTLVSNTMLISLGTFGSKLLVFFMVRFYTSYLTPAEYVTTATVDVHRQFSPRFNLIHKI